MERRKKRGNDGRRWRQCCQHPVRPSFPQFSTFSLFMVAAAIILLSPSCRAQSDVYDPSNSNFWSGAPFSAGGYGSGTSESNNNNPFAGGQDFGASGSVDMFGRPQQQQLTAFQVNGVGSFLPGRAISPSSSIYGTNGAGAYSRGAADEDEEEEEGEEGGLGGAAADDHTKFPTLIPPQKLATAGLTEPGLMVEDVTEPSQQNWAAPNRMGMIKDVSMMRSVPAPMPVEGGGPGPSAYGSFTQDGSENWMGGPGNFLGPVNDCFGSAGTNPAGGCPTIDTGGGGSYLSGDGAYQFPMPGEGQMMGGGGGMMGGMGNNNNNGAAMGMAPFGGNGFAGQQVPIGNQVNGIFPQYGGQQPGSGGGGGFGGGGGGGDNDEEEEEEQEEFGGIGSYVDNGPPPSMIAEGGGGGGGTFGQIGMAGRNEQERYLEYLEMVNRKYGIGMPHSANDGHHPSPMGTNPSPSSSAAAGFGLPPWGISSTAGGPSNGGQMRIGMGQGPVLGLGQTQEQQQICQGLQKQNQKMPFECAGGENGNARNSQVEAVAAAILASANGQRSGNGRNEGQQQQQHGGAPSNGGAGSIVGSIHGGGGGTSNGAHSSTSQAGDSAAGSNGGMPDGGEEKQQGGGGGGSGQYGSTMMGHLIGNSLANSLHKHSGLIPPSSPPFFSSSSSSSLDGGRVPFPFETTSDKQGIGVDGGPWLPPVPSVASLKMPSNGGRPPPHYELPSTAETSPPPPPPHQQRSIEAIQRQLLLALLSTTTTTTPPSTTTTTATATMVPTSKMTATEEEQMPVQKSTTSIQALTQQIRRLPAVLYADSRLPSSQKLETLLREVYGLPLVTFYVDRIDRPQTVERNLEQLTAHRGLPYLFICGTFIGSTEHIQNYHEQRQVPKLVEFVCNGGADKNAAASSQASRQQMDEPMGGIPVVGSNKTRLMRRGDGDKGGRKNGQTKGDQGKGRRMGEGRRKKKKRARKEEKEERGGLAKRKVEREEERRKGTATAQLSPRRRTKS